MICIVIRHDKSLYEKDERIRTKLRELKNVILFMIKAMTLASEVNVCFLFRRNDNFGFSFFLIAAGIYERERSNPIVLKTLSITFRREIMNRFTEYRNYYNEISFVSNSA